MQTVWTLIRRRVLRRLIRVYTVGLCPCYWTLGINGLKCQSESLEQCTLSCRLAKTCVYHLNSTKLNRRVEYVCPYSEDPDDQTAKICLLIQAFAASMLLFPIIYNKAKKLCLGFPDP